MPFVGEAVDGAEEVGAAVAGAVVAGDGALVPAFSAAPSSGVRSPLPITVTAPIIRLPITVTAPIILRPITVTVPIIRRPTTGGGTLPTEGIFAGTAGWRRGGG